MSDFFSSGIGEFIIQLIGFVAMAFSILSFQAKRRAGILVMQSVGCMIWALQFLLLGSPSAAILNVVGAIRNVLYSQRVKHPRLNTPLLPITFIIICIASCAVSISTEGPAALLSTFAMVMACVAFYMNDEYKIRLISLTIGPAWLLYDILSFSIAGMISETAATLSIIISLIRFKKPKKFPKVNTDYGE